MINPSAITPFARLNAIMVRVSISPLHVQEDFVREANASLDDALQDDALQNETYSYINKVARDATSALWSVGDQQTSLSSPISWTRWRGTETASGVGLLIHSPLGQRLLLPLDIDQPLVSAAYEGVKLLFSKVNPEETPANVIKLGSLYALPNENTHTISRSRFFGAKDPFSKKIKIKVAGKRGLFVGNNLQVGTAHIVAGGASDEVVIPDLGLSGMTSDGFCGHQEDGLCLWQFRLPGGPLVRILAGADGLGGGPLGEMASSAVLQGIHAYIVEMLARGTVPTVRDLALAAGRALRHQISLHTREIEKDIQDSKTLPFHLPNNSLPNTVAAIALIVGGQTAIATAGDFMFVHCRTRDNGEVGAIGYTDVDINPDSSLAATVGSGVWKFYQTRLEPGDWLVGASDGAFANLMERFKLRASSRMREKYGHPPPDQKMFSNVTEILRRTPQSHVAEAIHNVAMGDPMIPGLPELDLFDAYSEGDLFTLKLPKRREFDNVTAIAAHQLSQFETDTPNEPFDNAWGFYRTLEPVT